MLTRSNNSFWRSKIGICASFHKIHQAVHTVQLRQKATSQHRYRNHLIFYNCDRTVSVSGNIIKVGLLEQKGAGVMYTNAHSQHIF